MFERSIVVCPKDLGCPKHVVYTVSSAWYITDDNTQRQLGIGTGIEIPAVFWKQVVWVRVQCAKHQPMAIMQPVPRYHEFVRYKVKLFILLLFCILHWGKSKNYEKDFICFQSAQRPFVSVWSGHSLASSLSYPPLSLFVAVTCCHRHSGCHHYSVITLSPLVGTTAVTAFA
jgi:hypothetical protein